MILAMTLRPALCGPAESSLVDVSPLQAGPQGLPALLLSHLLMVMEELASARDFFAMRKPQVLFPTL